MLNLMPITFKGEKSFRFLGLSDDLGKKSDKSENEHCVQIIIV